MRANEMQKHLASDTNFNTAPPSRATPVRGLHESHFSNLLCLSPWTAKPLQRLKMHSCKRDLSHLCASSILSFVVLQQPALILSRRNRRSTEVHMLEVRSPCSAWLCRARRWHAQASQAQRLESFRFPGTATAPKNPRLGSDMN